MTTDDVLIALRDLKEKNNSEPCVDVAISAYTDLAIDEIFYKLSEYPNEDPEDVIFWYKAEMYACAPMLRNESVNSFIVAISTANTILAMFEHPKE